MSDRVAVMYQGRVVLEGTAAEIYSSPRNSFVADFVGKTNLLKGEIRGSEPQETEYLNAIETEIGLLHCRSRERYEPRAGVIIAIRPENIVLADSDREAAHNALSGEVTQVSYIGNFAECGVSIRDRVIRVQFHPAQAPQMRTRLRLRVDPAYCQVLGE